MNKHHGSTLQHVMRNAAAMYTIFLHSNNILLYIFVIVFVIAREHFHA